MLTFLDFTLVFFSGSLLCSKHSLDFERMLTSFQLVFLSICSRKSTSVLQNCRRYHSHETENILWMVSSGVKAMPCLALWPDFLNQKLECNAWKLKMYYGTTELNTLNQEGLSLLLLNWGVVVTVSKNKLVIVWLLLTLQNLNLGFKNIYKNT